MQFCEKGFSVTVESNFGFAGENEKLRDCTSLVLTILQEFNDTALLWLYSGVQNHMV